MNGEERVASPGRPLEGVSTGNLVRELFRGTSELLKKEVELGRAEVRSEIESGITRIVGVVIAGLCAFLAIGLLCTAAVLGLATQMAAWQAALIVAGILFVLAGIVFAVVKSKSKHKPLEKTQRTLKEDAQWAKEHVA